MTNTWNTVLYVGVTNDLLRRTLEHGTATNKHSFTAKYHLDKLVYYEVCYDAYTAISREKQLKGGSRLKKENLIRAMNPEWKDLIDEKKII